MKSENAKFAVVFPYPSVRRSGVLCHVTSLPGRYGIGDLGPPARRWIDMLARAGQRWWQMLPLGACDAGNSPYRCYSAFAGNPLLISPDLLIEEGLLTRWDAAKSILPAGPVNYPAVAQSKGQLLAAAYRKFTSDRRADLDHDYRKFVHAEADWLDEFALFVALSEADPSQSWTKWPVAIRRRHPTALKSVTTRYAAAIEYHKFVQFIFDRQLRSLRDHAAAAGVSLIGDLPIFVSPESADVWTHPHLFQLDRDLTPVAVSGVPPDLFSTTGQRWGNPLYNWKAMAADDFAWWKARLRSALNQADLVRIDHFRGFESYWRIPHGALTAQSGKWVKAPGEPLFNALLKDNPSLPLVAEDLGIITPEVEALRDRFRLPGMRVLQFGFTDEPGNPHTPHNFIKHCFAYTGTHDNDTAAGWFKTLPRGMKRRLKEYAPDADWHDDPAWSLIRLLLASTAGQTIVPLQDLLSLGSTARMNTPGLSERNWQWRLGSFDHCRAALEKLASLTRTYERDVASNRRLQAGPEGFQKL